MDSTKREGSRLDIHVLCTYPQKADLHFPQILTLKMSANGVSKQLFVRKQWFLLQTTHNALELAFTSTTAATDKPQCVRRLEFNASLPPSSISRKQKNKEIISSKRAGKDHKRSGGLTRHRHGTCDWWAHLPADSESTQQMLPPASCRAAATPESLPDLHQILLLLADRSRSSLLYPCEISGTEYCASSSSVPCVRQESFTPGGYVCMFVFRRGGGFNFANFAKFSIWKKWKKNTDKYIYIFIFFISIFWRIFFF